MTPTYRRSDDHNSYNRALREETERMGGNPYRAKYLEAIKRTMKPSIKNKILCFLLGHKDPVLEAGCIKANGFYGTLSMPKDKLYRLWRTEKRSCMRCGKRL